jgi:hypothetical protein
MQTSGFRELPIGHLPLTPLAVWRARLYVPALVAVTCAGTSAAVFAAEGLASETPMFMLVYAALVSWAHLGILAIAGRFERGGELAVAFVGTVFLVLVMWIGDPRALPGTASELSPITFSRAGLLACLAAVAFVRRPGGSVAREREQQRSDAAVRIADQRVPEAGPPPLRQWMRTSFVMSVAVLSVAACGVLAWWLIFRSTQWPDFGLYLANLGLDVFHDHPTPWLNLPFLAFASLPAMTRKDFLEAPRAFAAWPISAYQKAGHMVAGAIRHAVLVWAFLATLARLTAGPLDDPRIYLVPALAATLVVIDIARILLPATGPAVGVGLATAIQWGIPALLSARAEARFVIGVVASIIVASGLWVIRRLLRASRRIYRASA